MRASIHAVRAELAANQELLFEALKAKRYWNPQRQSLRSTEWHRRRDLIGSGEREYREAYEKVERAHRQFNRMNELVEGRRASESAVGPIGAEMIPTLAIEPADRADEALQLASRAYGALGKLLDGL